MIAKALQSGHCKAFVIMKIRAAAPRHQQASVLVSTPETRWRARSAGNRAAPALV